MSGKISSTVGLALLVPALTVAAIQSNPKTLVRNYPRISGSEPGPPASILLYHPQVPQIAETDLIGDTLTLGMTWWENQHNGTCGRMNVLESDGWRQFAWTKGENNGAFVRHVWWNGIDPNGIQVYPGNGVAAESSSRGGFVNMDVGSNGIGFPAYHNVISGVTQTATSMDLIPHSGAFLDFQAPAAPTLPNTLIWPRIAISQNQRIRIVSSENSPAAGNPQRMYYLSATYDAAAITMTYDPAWTYMDWTQVTAADLDVSPIAGSNKLLIAWSRSREYTIPNQDSTYTQLNNDLYYLIDMDGQNPDFSQAVNLTNFIPPDPLLLPDTLLADRDTLRVYTDLNCFIDHNNYAHLAFTTRSFFELEGGVSYFNASILWHWSEQFPDTFSVIGNYYALNNSVDCGAWNLKAQRPSLGEDAAGNLYCMYQVYDTDTLRLSQAGWPSGEIYLTVSTDGGMHWAEGTNVTNTLSPQNAPSGRCLSELTPTMAKKVDSACHLIYVLDLDAGNVMQTEGVWTNNPVRYHRVPVSLIPTTPIVPNIPLHVGPVNAVPPSPEANATPTAFALKQICPNPFNPTTSITFTLEAVSHISLDVLNSQGQMVVNVTKGTFGPGTHTVNFTAEGLSSGVYFCKLTAGTHSALQKMVLMK